MTVPATRSTGNKQRLTSYQLEVPSPVTWHCKGPGLEVGAVSFSNAQRVRSSPAQSVAAWIGGNLNCARLPQ
jgi:hypothetical protein